VSIVELDKPARVLCRHLVQPDRGCGIHGEPERPQVCRSFLCSWMRGHGGDEDRPDKIGAMLSVNDIEGGRFVLALELRSGAVLSSAAAMVATLASATRLPVVISDYESLPPDDKGDRVAVHTSILYRSRRMVGRLLSWLAPDVALHELVKGG
jgi:hypothetical protein